MKLDLGHYKLIWDQRGPEGVGELTTRSWIGPDGMRVGHIGWSLKHMNLDLGHYRLI